MRKCREPCYGTEGSRGVLGRDNERRIFEIGGPDVVTYGQIMKEYARQRGLRRWLISVPVLTPRLSSLWLGLVTPVYARIGRKLIESMRNPTVIHDRSASDAFEIRPRGFPNSEVHRHRCFRGGKTRYWRVQLNIDNKNGVGRLSKSADRQ